MAQHQFKGISADQELAKKTLIRDTRSTAAQFFAMLVSREMSMTLLITCAAGCIFWPTYAHLCLIGSILLFYMRKIKTKDDRLPIRMPNQYNKLDFSAPIPGRRSFKKGEGVLYFGNEFGTNHELWGAKSDILTHMLVFGTTGSGKTEFLVSMALNAIAMGSGLSYIDPKAAPKLMAQIYVLARICGRDDDFRTINFLTASKSSDPTIESPVRTTNTTNPFAYGNAESMSDILISLIPSAEGGNAIFNKNAQALIRAAMYGLVELRDKGELDLSAETIRERLTLKSCMDLAENTGISAHARASISAFLTSVGWQEGVRMERQPKSLPEQFGYARSYFGEPLNSLTDTYGHIYGTNHGEIDMKDVIMNRRILVIALPALAVSPEELKNLGKIVLSSIRNAIATGLGDGREGAFGDTIFSLPTDAPAPFLSITDEYAAIPTPGYVEVLTQGRGLGISAIVASQDYAGIKKSDENAAQQILENTKFKFILKMESATDTWDVVKALAGEGVVMETAGVAIKQESGATGYTDELRANAKSRSRIELQDLQQQVDGEFHLFNNGNIIRGSAFYADVPLDPNMQLRIPTMLTINMPDRRVIEAKYGKTKIIVDYLLAVHRGEVQIEHHVSDVSLSDTVTLLLMSMEPKIRLNRMDKGIAAMMQIMDAQTHGAGGLNTGEPSRPGYGADADLLDKYLDEKVPFDDVLDDAFKQSAVDATAPRDADERARAENAAQVEELSSDIAKTLNYPPSPIPQGGVKDELIDQINSMITGLSTEDEKEE